MKAIKYENSRKLECGPMRNVMAALPSAEYHPGA